MLNTATSLMHGMYSPTGTSFLVLFTQSIRVLHKLLSSCFSLSFSGVILTSVPSSSSFIISSLKNGFDLSVYRMVSQRNRNGLTHPPDLTFLVVMDGRECAFLLEEHKKDGTYCQGDFIATEGVLRCMTEADFRLMSLYCPPLELTKIEMVVEPASFDQFPVRPLLDDPAVVDYQDLAGISDCAQAVGDHEAGPPRHQTEQSLVDAG